MADATADLRKSMQRRGETPMRTKMGFWTSRAHDVDLHSRVAGGHCGDCSAARFHFTCTLVRCLSTSSQATAVETSSNTDHLRAYHALESHLKAAMGY